MKEKTKAILQKQAGDIVVALIQATVYSFVIQMIWNKVMVNACAFYPITWSGAFGLQLMVSFMGSLSGYFNFIPTGRTINVEWRR